MRDTYHAESRVIKGKGIQFFVLREHTAGRSFDITLVLSGTLPAYADIVCQCPINVADEDNRKECERGRERKNGGGIEKRERRRGGGGRGRAFFGERRFKRTRSPFPFVLRRSDYPPDLPRCSRGSSVNLRSSTSTRRFDRPF